MKNEVKIDGNTPMRDLQVRFQNYQYVLGSLTLIYEERTKECGFSILERKNTTKGVGFVMHKAEEYGQRIQTALKEVADIERRFKDVGQEKLRQITEIAIKGGMEFEVIHKHSSDDHELQEEWFIDNGGNEKLKGILVIDECNDGGYTDGVGWESHREVFLLNDGSVRTFTATYKDKYCSRCEAKHSTVERFESNEQYESEFMYEDIISKISRELFHMANRIEARKKYLVFRIDNLDSVASDLLTSESVLHPTYQNL